jgi:ABC-type transport system involved in multi-copper enzyme maturation permease subunit
MSGTRGERLADQVRLVRLAATTVAGRRFWIVPLLPLLWLPVQIGWLWLQAGAPPSYEDTAAQNALIGLPLSVMAVGLGVRIIAGEIEGRTLEIAYTVPGGTHRVWLAKLAAAMLLLLAAEALLALAVFLFCTEFPAGALYGALQAAMFYMVVAMAWSALFKSEAAGALVTVAMMFLNLFLHGLLPRVSPFWNPTAQGQADTADVIAWTVQNRIGFVLVIAAVTALAFGRAERREKLL